MAAFLPLSEKKNVPEVQLKSFGLMILAEEILRQTSIDSVVWLFLFTRIQVYNEKERAEQEKNINCVA